MKKIIAFTLSLVLFGLSTNALAWVNCDLSTPANACACVKKNFVSGCESSKTYPAIFCQNKIPELLKVNTRFVIAECQKEAPGFSSQCQTEGSYFAVKCPADLPFA